MSQLVLIGGPPAVGKTTALAHVATAAGRCAVLDADDVWRIHPFEVNDTTRPLAEGNVVAVLRGFLEAGYPRVFLTWVLAVPPLIERLLGALEGHYESASVLHLVLTPEALRQRCAREPDEGRVVDYALLKLEQIQALPTPKIDTTDRTPAEVAARILTTVEDGAARWKGGGP